MTRTATKPKSSAPRGRGPAKLHRWIDLLAALLARSSAVTFRELAHDVPAYSGSDKSEAALMRMFERDKDELRALGIPIESVPLDAGETSAYRLQRRDFYLPYLLAVTPGERPATPRRSGWLYNGLPTLAFEPDELSAIAQAAARVAELGDPLLEEETRSAMRKLAVDLPFDPSVPSGDTVLVAERPADLATFEALDDALQRRKRVAFTYHSMSSDSTAEREVEPYGLFFVASHWYLAAHDRIQDGLRNFRLSRMSDVRVNAASPATHDYEIPPSFRLREHARSKQAWELGDAEPSEVIVRVTSHTGATLAAAKLGALVPGEPEQRAFAVRRMDAFLRWMLSFAGGMVPVSPPDVAAAYRDEIRRTLAVYGEETPDE
jgi:proteasome accessory factor B